MTDEVITINIALQLSRLRVTHKCQQNQKANGNADANTFGLVQIVYGEEDVCARAALQEATRKHALIAR